MVVLVSSRNAPPNKKKEREGGGGGGALRDAHIKDCFRKRDFEPARSFITILVIEDSAQKFKAKRRTFHETNQTQ